MSDKPTFTQNGGFCWICDANHSQLVYQGKEICEKCRKRIVQAQIEQARN